MDYRIELDIAYIKAAVSEYARQGAECRASNAALDRIRRELEDTCSKVHELDMFQTVIKEFLVAAAVTALVVLILVISKAAEGGSSGGHDS